MVGSGGGGGGGTGASGGHGGSGTPETDCSRLIFEASIASPNPAVVATLAVGDICDVALLSTPTRIAVLTRPAGEVLGAITEQWHALVSCIGQGATFEAEVLQVMPYVRVQVRPAR